MIINKFLYLFFILYNNSIWCMFVLSGLISVCPSIRLYVRPSVCLSSRPPIHPSTKGLERIEKSRKGQERAGSERKVLERGRRASNSRTCISFICGSPCLNIMNWRKGAPFNSRYIQFVLYIFLICNCIYILATLSISKGRHT